MKGQVLKALLSRRELCFGSLECTPLSSLVSRTYAADLAWFHSHTSPPVRRWFRISGKRMRENEIWSTKIDPETSEICEQRKEKQSLSVGLNVVYWLSGVGSAQAANTSAALKPLFFQRGPVIWKVRVNVALGLDVADVCCQFGKVH